MDIECTICLNNIITTELCVTNCNHNFCYDCLQKWLKKKTCPNCRKNIESFKYKNETNRIFYINYLEDINLNENELNNILRNNINFRNRNKNLLLSLRLICFSSIFFLSSTIYLTINCVSI